MRDAPYPETLSHLQTWFAGFITGPIKECDHADIPLFPSAQIEEIRRVIAPSPHLASEERLGIYQQQYWWRLLGICQEIFPSLVRLFDYGDFNKMIAEPYLLAYPPSDWFLSRIGDNLSRWIQSTYRSNDASLVLGLAQIDLGYEKLLFTPLPERTGFDPKFEEKKLFLQPFVLLFTFQADLFDFHYELMQQMPEYWQTNDFPPLKKNGKKRYFVLHRSEEQSMPEEISPFLHTLLKKFQKGARLADLVPLLEKNDELLESFHLLGKRGWLTLENPKKRV